MAWSAITAGCAQTDSSAALPTGMSHGALPQTATRYNVIFDFGSSVNGYYGIYPLANLIELNGTLFGTTSGGGGSASAPGYGTVFTITPSGTERVLHTFNGSTDGAFPEAGLVAVKGFLYGTTGGNGVYGSTYGDGTIFRLKADGSHFRVLHTFTGVPDGAYPLASLLWYRGRFYGTTQRGGVDNDGTAFTMTTAGRVKIIHSFTGYGRSSDGGYPQSALIAFHNRLYGTTEFGGAASVGTVFAITRQGQETMVYSFGPSLPEPRYPVAGVVARNGNLYGTSYSGGSNNYGAAFSVRADGSSDTVLHSFANGNDGSRPEASLIYVGGKFYGTTAEGGSVGYGTVFSVDDYGNEQIVRTFGENYNNDGIAPVSALLNVNRTLYGTTTMGGVSLPSCPHSAAICDWGTVFALTP